jgi:hypothetical protein
VDTSRLPVLVAAAALTLATPALRAGEHHAAEPVPVVVPALPDALLAELLLLADDACDVRYVPGSLDRAAHVEEWLRALTIGGVRRTGGGSRVVAVVLDRESWGQARLACPYGMPCFAGERVVALPAAGDAGTVALWRAQLGGLPVLDGVPFLGTPEEAASLWPADQVAASLAARSLLATSGLHADEEWVMDLLGHALALDAAHQAHVDLPLVAFWHTLLERPAPSRDDAEGNELRRQARLFSAAESMLGGSHKLSVKSLRKMQEKAGGVLRAADVRAEWPNAVQIATPR